VVLAMMGMKRAIRLPATGACISISGFYLLAECFPFGAF
jgi:hypothetical protein